MRVIEWIQFIAGVTLIFGGLGIFLVQFAGVIKFKYVLNRMHAAAMGDTMGIGLCLLGVIILTGLNFTSLKLAMVMIFLWLASPVASHLISRLEVITNEHLEEFCEVQEVKEEGDNADI